jgi:hypothetical protein
MVSLNVHAWRDRRRRSNTRRVAVLVRDLRPHVLCLQAFVPPPHRSARPPLRVLVLSVLLCIPSCQRVVVVVVGVACFIGAGGAGAAALVRG